ncbi:hypothetical protein GE09DRAFT_555998 [Coniochaeta sp. 2T2.1]|nr:hypothetical protein GE09DRAFT_555998 [Coniochaeta sp. 2T2.1]
MAEVASHEYEGVVNPESHRATNADRNVLSFGCELEFIVAWIFDNEPDPDEGNNNLAPIRRVPNNLAESIEPYIHRHLDHTIRKAVFKIQRDLGEDEETCRFGLAVKPDTTVKETEGDEQWKGYRFQGCELNSSASWTSAVSFQELELVTRILLRNYRIRVNSSCGLQFHIGNGLKPLNTQTVRRIAALLWCIDPIAGQIHPPQRRRGLMTLSIRDFGKFAREGYISQDVTAEEFFKDGKIGKPTFGGSPRMASSAPARNRCYPTSRLPTTLAPKPEHDKLEEKFPDGFYWVDFLGLPGQTDEYSTLDGVRRFLACSTTSELKESISPPSKPNYSFTGYEGDINFNGQDEWLIDGNEVSDKLIIEFRQAIGSMDAEWICAWGRICAAIVLFAKNASTVDFFSMALRLAQAQGDFGDPGPAPYDFIDFLDDIGCFAEAELLR